jgi:hypothetical protein
VANPIHNIFGTCGFLAPFCLLVATVSITATNAEANPAGCIYASQTNDAQWMQAEGFEIGMKEQEVDALLNKRGDFLQSTTIRARWAISTENCGSSNYYVFRWTGIEGVADSRYETAYSGSFGVFEVNGQCFHGLMSPLHVKKTLCISETQENAIGSNPMFEVKTEQ